MFDVDQLLAAPADSRRGELGAALRRIARHEPSGLVEVPERVTVYRTIQYDAEKCLGCGACAAAARSRPSRRSRPSPTRLRPHSPPSRRWDGMSAQPTGNGAGGSGTARQERRPRGAPAGLCCASAPAPWRTSISRRSRAASCCGRGDAWRHCCGREGPARLLELIESRTAGGSCSPAARRTSPTAASIGCSRAACKLETADIREGAPGSTATTGAAVTDKAERILDRGDRYPDGQPSEALARAPRRQRAGDRRWRERHADRLRAGPDGPPRGPGRAPPVPGRPGGAHRHRLSHQRLRPVPADHGRAGRHAQVLPPQSGDDNENMHIWRRTTVQSVAGAPGNFTVELRSPAQHGHRRLRQLRHLRDGLPEQERQRRRHQHGRLQRVLRRPCRRTVDLRGARSAAPARERARSAPSTSPVAELATVKAGAILTAVGCEPAPDHLIVASRLRSGRGRHPDRPGRTHGQLGRAGLAGQASPPARS